MDGRQEGQAPQELLQAAVRTSNLAGSTAEAVDRILASTEEAVASIRAQTEAQVRQMAADLEARAHQEAIERRARLEQVRRELADRASMIATAYEAVSQQLWTIDTALAGLAPDVAPRGRPVPFGQPQGMPARVTLRERQRIDMPYDETMVPVAAPAIEPAPRPAIEEESASRRWWVPWQREAA